MNKDGQKLGTIEYIDGLAQLVIEAEDLTHISQIRIIGSAQIDGREWQPNLEALTHLLKTSKLSKKTILKLVQEVAKNHELGIIFSS